MRRAARGNRETNTTAVTAPLMWLWWLFTRADRKSQVSQFLGFCTADFWPSYANESAEQKPKHFLTWDFISALLFTQEGERPWFLIDSSPRSRMASCHCAPLIWISLVVVETQMESQSRAKFVCWALPWLGSLKLNNGYRWYCTWYLGKCIPKANWTK